MATFRSSIKILSEFSTKQGCRPHRTRSYSEDCNSILHRNKSSDRKNHESSTTLSASRSWYSLFQQNKPPEIEEGQKGTNDIKNTPENESCLPSVNDEVSREKPPPLSYNCLKSSHIKVEEEPKAVQQFQKLLTLKENVTAETQQMEIPLKSPIESKGQSCFPVANEELQQLTANVETDKLSVSTVKGWPNFIFLPSQIIKRNHSSFVGDPLWHPNRSPYKCQEQTDTTAEGSEGTKKKKRKERKECDKRPGPDCKVPLTVDCRRRLRNHPPCALRPAPKPSYSECLKDPTPPLQFTECKIVKETDCPPPRRNKSHDGCEKKRKIDICPVTVTKKDTKHGNKTNEFTGGYSKLSMLCLPLNFMTQHNQSITRSYSLSYCNHKPLISYEDEGRMCSQRDPHFKRTYSLNRAKSNLSRNAIQCARKDDNVSSPPTTDRSCRKLDELKKDEGDSTCNKITAPGCKPPEFADCREQEKSMIIDTCTKIYPPQPSFSECIKDPPPPVRFTECRETFEEKCPEEKKKKSYDGCNPEKPKELPCPEPRGKQAKKKGADCEDIKDNKCDDEPKSWGKPAFTKPPMKCLPTQNTISNQNQIIKRSYSYMSNNSLSSPSHQYQIRFNYPRNVSSYSFIEPPNCGNNSQMQCSNGKGSKSGPSSCKIVDSGVEKKKKSQKECNKVTAPGCKPIRSTECKSIVKELPPCKKVLAPKPSYSECLREKTPPRPFTECIIRKIDKCPGEKVVKSYDGCAPKKKEEFVCPEPEPEKPKPKKKKIERDECDKKDECEDVEPFKFKSGYSKPAMKCSSINTLQHNLNPVRLYSDLKTEITNKPQLPYGASSYTNCQINDLKVRLYSKDQKSKKPKKSKYDTIPCPENPDPPCRKEDDKKTGPGKCGEAIIPLKHFIECKEPPKKKVHVCEQLKTTIVAKRVVEVKVEKPKPKTYIECPPPPPKHKGKFCDLFIKPPPPPPIKECPIKDKHFIECKPPPPREKHTCENPLVMKVEEKVERPAGICRGDRLVKTFIECPEPPPRKKGIVCEPFKPRMEPCFGQVRKDEKTSRKKCGVDPDDPTPACPEKKKDDRRKCSQHPNGGISMFFPPFSSGNTMKYSTSKPMENQNFSKKLDLPTFFSDENSLTMANFTCVKQSDETRETAMTLPASSTFITMGCSYPKQTEHLESLKKNSTPIFSPLSNGATVNFSTSKIAWKSNSSFCKKPSNPKNSQASEYIEKCEPSNSVSSNITPCKKPPVKPTITCETMTNNEDDKKTVKSLSCRTEEKSYLDVCQKSCDTTSNKDGTLEELLCIIKSWFSFLKAREGCPEPGSKRKRKQVRKIEGKGICTSSQVKEAPCEPKEEIKEQTNKLSKIEIQVAGKCPKMILPGCKVPESTSCSKKVRTSKEPECKKIPAPVPSFSECTKELLEPPRFTECNISEFEKCKKTTPVIKPSACEIYFRQNKKPMKPEFTVELDLKEPEKAKPSSICEKSIAPAEKNIFVRMLNKKSKLPECQIEEQMMKPNCQLESLSKPAKDKESNSNCKQAILDPKEADGIMVDVKKEKKGGPVTITVEGICVPTNVQSSSTKKATDCTIGEADKNKDCITEPYIQSQPPKTEKSVSGSTSTKKNIEHPSKKSMLSHDSSQIHKRASSTSPSSMEIGSKIYERSSMPILVANIDYISKINLKKISRPSLKVKSTESIKTKKTLKTHHKVYKMNMKQKNRGIQSKFPKQYAPSKLHNESPSLPVVSKNMTRSNKKYLAADKVDFERIKELNYQPGEQISYDGYMTLIKKFPQMLGTAVGSNYLNDIWSYCQKDLPSNSIFKIPDPKQPKSNPKIVLPVSELKLSQTKEVSKCEKIDAEED